ncbi:MAG TPA: fatty acid desaturase, partial [Paracoccaceae bacterium]|nr:fatty acid desaturase [Paracoccaceae bacterium]
MQLLLSDYVQHYGLRRRTRADGRLEPVGPQHSWNAAPWFSAAVMLNAPRHSDHHLNPARPYPALRLDAASMPVLPRSLPVMAMLALWPAAWRRVMDAKVALWQDPGGGELPVASAVP